MKSLFLFSFLPLLISARPEQDIKHLFRIAGGVAATKDEFPYQVMLTRQNGFLFCGGSLISDYYVITAAHCVINMSANSIIVRLGDYDWTQNNETTHVNIPVQNVIIHPKFKLAISYHDIAIIKLARRAMRTPSIKPICLAPPTKDFIGEEATISGWGSPTIDTFPENFLHKLTLKVISYNECQDLLKGYSIYLVKEKICGWAPNKDSCKGDSGGPLMWENSTTKKQHLIGIVSMGFCGNRNKPGLFTRITSYLDWIKDNTVGDSTICWS